MEGVPRGLLPSTPSALQGLLLEPWLPPPPGGEDILRPLEFALSHLQSEAACNPHNPILMNLCAPELAGLGEIKLSKLISPPGRLEGNRGLAPDGIRVVLRPINAELHGLPLGSAQVLGSGVPTSAFPAVACRLVWSMHAHERPLLASEGAFPIGLCPLPGLNEEAVGGGRGRRILINREQRENVRSKAS